MRCSTIEDRFADLLRSPDAERYLAARELIASDPEFRDQAARLTHLSREFEAENYSAVLQLSSEWWSWACLSPRFHFWIGVSASATGDSERAHVAKERFRAILHAIMQTGDGEESSPFAVTYVSDAYDVLRLLDEQPVGQTAIETPDGLRDAIYVEGDDEPFWFDVTALLPTGLRSAELLQAQG